MKREILAIIPARGGSKGIRKKNMVLLCGKPLIQYTIDAAKKSTLISRIILSSDDDEIMNHCKSQDIEVPFRRPFKLAQDNTPMINVVKHTIKFLKKKENYMPEYIILLQPTSPLRTAQHIDEALNKLINSDADSIVSVMEVPHQFNPFSVMKLDVEGNLAFFIKEGKKYSRRQDKPILYARNGPAIFASKYEFISKSAILYNGKLLPYFMKRENSIDIDNTFNLILAEILLKERI